MNLNFKNNKFGVNAIRKLALAALAGVAISVAACSSASAVTITFDTGVKNKKIYTESGFQVNPPRIVHGNCFSYSCLALNKEENSILSMVIGSKFKLTDFSFKLLGKKASLLVEGFSGNLQVRSLLFESSANDDDYEDEGGQSTVNLFSVLKGKQVWSNLTSVAFSLKHGGNARIDDIVLSTFNGANPSPVPVPGALPLLLTGMVGIGLLGRRRKRAI